MSRGQLSLSVVEAAIGVVLVLGVAAGFAVGATAPTSSTPQLDALAHDTATVLGSEPTDRGQDSRLAALARSDRSFARTRESTRRRIVDLLPADVVFHVRTPRGSFGYPHPPTAAVGSVTVPTRYGPVTIRVWYG
ncbi:DUF7262 family protein [Haloplanus aerogenes]|uniref:Uncharacterized protein n=1 Tax=Haloplanus aerogenes TaxID=660522 RepID=A0A3M0DPT1_9EURY|nr:hypothetical protein [Haloplanus aerogenes]AZH24530.1 hypothetical protein DU502_03645 [Haloplanus aerogenes]RMB23818.1 hypothetical protein ATH50_1048 [Haloplanus aerogenes]